MIDDDRIDLSALDLDWDPTRLERSARAIAARVAPSLRRRLERPPGLWLGLAQWRRPVFAAAALVAVASIAVLTLPRRGPAAAAGASSLTLAEAEGVPAALAGWVEGGKAPSGARLLDMEVAP